MSAPHIPNDIDSLLSSFGDNDSSGPIVPKCDVSLERPLVVPYVELVGLSVAFVPDRECPLPD